MLDQSQLLLLYHKHMFNEEVIKLLQDLYRQVEEINDSDRDPEDVLSWIQNQINHLSD